MTYAAFIFALALACIAGMEFVVLMSVETRNRQLKRRVGELEQENSVVKERLKSAEALIKQAQEEGDEAWPELIDDNYLR